MRLTAIYRLGIKELISLRYDAVLLVLLAYAFTVAVYMPAAGSIIGVHNASVAFVDEDHSALSRRLAQSLLPPEFAHVQSLPYSALDEALDAGRYTFVVNIPPQFEKNVLAGRVPQLQIYVDATAMSQAFMGAGYMRQIFTRELAPYAAQPALIEEPQVRLNSRVLFNPNLDGGWFLALIQVINQITILAIILTGSALLREREHGTIDHLLVLPLSAAQIMLAKVLSNGLVVLLCAWLSLRIVVGGLLNVPLTGSMPLFLAACALYLFATTALGVLLATVARSIPQFGLLSIPVVIPMLLLSGGSTPLESMPLWLQYVMQLSPSTHFVSASTAILFRDAGFALVWPQVLAIAGLGAVFFAWALQRFRRSLIA